MALQLTIQLFKDPKEKPEEVIQKFISFEMLGELEKMTSGLGKGLSTEKDLKTQDQVDKITDIVSYLFGRQVSAGDLKKYGDISEIFECFLALGSISDQFSQKQINRANKKAMLAGKKN